MAATSGFSFGSNSTSLFGAKTSAPSSFSFGGAATTPATGFSFGSAAQTSSTGSSLFGAKPAATSSLFGVKPLTSGTTAAAAPFQFGKPLGSTTAASTTGFSLLPTTAATATSLGASTEKPPENPKDHNVPTELTSLVTELETYIKKQKDIKEEIAKISSQEISRIREDTTRLNQAVEIISNSLQRDSIAVANLKHEVGQELKNSELAHRMKDASSFNPQYDFSAPMEYFQRLVYSFETRISNYRLEIEELEIFLSSSSNTNQISPQNLSDVLKHLNNSFIGLASELHQIHETVKAIKQKYIQYRRFVYNENNDPFLSTRHRHTIKGGDTIGPSPFPIVQGASLLAQAQKQENKAPSLGLTQSIGFGTNTGFTSSFGKPTGLTRSLSVGGKTSTGFGNQTIGGSGGLFGKSSSIGITPGLNLAGTTNTPSFTLQKPPSGKRGKLF